MKTPSDPITAIHQSVLGERRTIRTPFGKRPLVYADYVASGRALGFVEDAIRETLLPLYANTRTETSHTGAHTTRLREAARHAIRAGVGADRNHAVVFAGSGATAAIDKLVRAMDLHLPSPGPRPTVFVGPHEHHSNDLPWREAQVDIVRVPLARDGRACLESLAAALAASPPDARRIGVFSAVSNVTGVKADLAGLARLLHAHDALFFCDFAAGGPYMPIATAESAPGAGDRIDAAFLSAHKFVGGPGASGILVADRALLSGSRPSVAGGGTVSYVTQTRHVFVTDPERREEAGTPNVVGDIRAGLVVRLKTRIGAPRIEALEERMVARALEAWRDLPGLELLGPQDAPRFCVFAFNVRRGRRLLHHNFTVALLNDLFGIQARGGCSCAGPYGHHLLGIDEARAAAHEEAVGRGFAALRPGWARLGLNFFLDEETVDYILSAVAFVARRGAQFLPYHDVDPHSGTWRARTGRASVEHGSDLLDGLLDGERSSRSETCPLAGVLEEAERLADRALRTPFRGTPFDAQGEALRWFWLPNECENATESLQ